MDNNNTYHNVWDEITYPFSNLTVQPLKVVNAKVISPHTLLCIWLHTHSRIKIKPYQ